jgi:hypothetical protein
VVATAIANAATSATTSVQPAPSTRHATGRRRESYQSALCREDPRQGHSE